jgi:hypothetical protein
MEKHDQVRLGSLGYQSLRRPLTEPERCLAAALEAIFATGRHEFAQVVEDLQRQGVPRPSGGTAPWTVETLEHELRQINESLDRAYVQHGGQLLGA